MHQTETTRENETKYERIHFGYSISFRDLFFFHFLLHYYYYLCLDYLTISFRFVCVCSVHLCFVVNQIFFYFHCTKTTSFPSNKMYKGFVRLFFIFYCPHCFVAKYIYLYVCVCVYFQTNECASLSSRLIRLQFFHWKAHKYKEASEWNAMYNENIQTDACAHVDHTGPHRTGVK